MLHCIDGTDVDEVDEIGDVARQYVTSSYRTKNNRVCNVKKKKKSITDIRKMTFRKRAVFVSLW